MSKALNELIDEILSSEEVIRFKKLESIILKNEEVNSKIIRLREVEKQAVNARELGLENAYFMYKKEYDEILSSFENDVLISSYLDSKEEVKSLINLVIGTIEDEINNVING
jgi:cell fate (sporulation/competence/biofilm development) regulator YmcA (YheA/YmcA/DUF963 family)